MSNPMKISPRFAGQVELTNYCPRCCWYALRIKHMPFEKGMPGIMFYLEQIEKAIILEYVHQNGKVPDYFGPFSDCTEPVDFPFQMQAYHSDADVYLTARADMMFRRANGDALMLDLKTSKPDGGGSLYRPQYEVQVIGYSWVAEAAHVAKVDGAGLLYCEVMRDSVRYDPSDFMTKTGFSAPFRFEMHSVELDYSRLTKCLKEVKKLWDLTAPPRGADKCKNCALLNALFNFEAQLRSNDAMLRSLGGLLARDSSYNDYNRLLATGSQALLNEAMEFGLKTDDLGTMWHLWWNENDDQSDEGPNRLAGGPNDKQ